MLTYMFDTDISSYIMKRSNAAVMLKLQSVEVAEVCVSAITKCELMYGVEVSPQRQRDEAALSAFLRHVQVLDFSAGAALDYAGIRADLKQRGALIGGNDLLIAAHALSLGLTLVTNNTAEFGRVKGLKVENWTEPII
jgi:tRNA(fMet)-specific endonuclease VapC